MLLNGVRRPPRAVGEAVRRHLLDTALSLFAESGFAATSIRSIAWTAGVNVASIHYHFVDKEGLYEACLAEPAHEWVQSVAADGAALDEELHQFLTCWIRALADDQILGRRMRLQLRELLEPSGRWSGHVVSNLKVPHTALVAMLCRYLGTAPDDDVHGLAVSIAGLVMQLFTARKFTDALEAVLPCEGVYAERWVERLHAYAMAMVQADVARRQATRAASAGLHGGER